MVELTLKWEKFGLCQGLHGMMENQELVDVTIMCEGQFFQAHRNVLAASSEQFKLIFKSAANKNPILVLKGVKIVHLKNILQFIYLGEVTVPQGDLAEFLSTADELGISALAGSCTKPPDPPDLKPEVQKPSNLKFSSSSATKTIRLKPVKPNNATPVTYNVMASSSSSTSDQLDNSDMICDDGLVADEVANEVVIASVEMVSEDWSEVPFVDIDTVTQGSNLSVEPLEGCFNIDVKNVSSIDQEEPGPCADEVSVECVEPPDFRRTSSRPKIKRQRSESPPANDCDNSDLEWAMSMEQENQLNLHQDLGCIIEGIPTAQQTLETDNFKCAQCPLTFATTYMRGRHERLFHSDVTIVTCNFCQKVFKNRQSLRSHLNKFHTGSDVGLTFTCLICKVKLQSKSDFVTHTRNLHGDLSTPKRCTLCQACCKNYAALKRHVRTKHMNSI